MKLTEEEKKIRTAKAKATRKAKDEMKERERKSATRTGEISHCLEEGSRTDPTRSYEIGDEVVMGSNDKAVVIDKLHDGMVYEIELSNKVKDKIWSEKTHIEIKTIIVPWQRILPKSSGETLEVPRFTQADTMRIDFSQREISGLLSSFYYFGIDMDPEYQRGHVWDYDDKVALIDSIFNNVDIGKFVLIHLDYSPNGPSYEILDGKQRLTAIVEFYEDRFRYRGKLYSELHPRDRNHICHYRIGIGETREISTTEEKLKYFLYLNTFGKPQDPLHIAKIQSMLAGIRGI